MGLVKNDAFKTTILSYLGMGIGYINKFFLFLLILTTEQIGLVNLLVSVGTLFAQIGNLGTVFTTIRFLPFFKNEEKKHHGFLPLMLMVAFIGLVVCSAIVVLFRETIESMYVERSADFVHYYYWIIPIGAAMIFFMVLEAYLRSFYKNIIPVFAFEILLRIGVLISLLLLWAEVISFDSFVIINCLLYFLPTTVLLIYLIKMGEFNVALSSIKISKRFRKIIWTYTTLNYTNTVGQILVVTLDMLMIARMIGLEAVGVYSLVLFMISATQVPYRSLIRISAPVIAHAWKHKEMEKIQDLYSKVSSVLLVFCITMFFLIWFNIDFIFSFLKPEFQEGIYVFFFLMIGRLFDMYCGINGTIFNTSKKYGYDMLFTIFNIVAVVSLNLWLIPIYGIVGAAIATASTIVLYNIGRIVFIWMSYDLHPFSWKQLQVWLLGIICFAGSYLIQQNIESLWINAGFQILFIGLGFLAPIYFFNLEPESVTVVKKIIKRLKY